MSHEIAIHEWGYRGMTSLLFGDGVANRAAQVCGGSQFGRRTLDGQLTTFSIFRKSRLGRWRSRGHVILTQVVVEEVVSNCSRREPQKRGWSSPDIHQDVLSALRGDLDDYGKFWSTLLETPSSLPRRVKPLSKFP